MAQEQRVEFVISGLEIRDGGLEGGPAQDEGNGFFEVAFRAGGQVTSQQAEVVFRGRGFRRTTHPYLAGTAKLEKQGTPARGLGQKSRQGAFDARGQGKRLKRGAAVEEAAEFGEPGV